MSTLTLDPATAAPPALRDLDDDQLRDRYLAAADDTELAAILGEARRRDRDDRKSNADNALRYEWYDAMHAQRMAAEAFCGGGGMLNREGLRRQVSEWDMWTGPQSAIDRYGSEDLAWYFTHIQPRLTFTEYKRQRHQAGRIQREQWRDRHDMSSEGTADEQHDDDGTAGPRLADDDTRPLRRDQAPPQAPQGGPGRHVHRGGSSPLGADDSSHDGTDSANGGSGGTVPPVAREDGDDMNPDDSNDDTASQEAAPAPDDSRPEHTPGDLKFILEETAEFISRYVVATPGQVDALTLYAAATWVITAFPTLGRLLISGETEASGKTVALTVTAALSANPLDASGTSYALQSALAAASNAPEQLTPTLYYDEVSGIFGRSGLAATRDPLAEILRKGYKKGATRAWSVNRTSETYSIYTPFIMAGLRNAVPRDIRTRCISIVMRAGTPREYFDAREAESDARALAGSLGQAVTSRTAEIEGFRARGMHPRLLGRLLEVWEPLFAVAWWLGGQEWLNRCMAAFRELALSDAGQVALSPRQQILRDAAELLDGPLAAMAEDGFAGGLALADEMRRLDNPLYAARSEAAMCKLIADAMQIPTTQKRVDGKPVRGYFAHEIRQAWEAVRPPEMEDAVIPEEDNPFAVTDDTAAGDEWPAYTGVTGDTADSALAAVLS